MGFDEVLQNGDKIVIAGQGVIGAVDILSLDIAVFIQNQLVGKARAAGIGHAVFVAVNHVLEVVDHGLGEHERLLPLREENGLGLELIGSVNGLPDADEVIKVHQYVVVGVELLQNLGELVDGDKVLIVLSAKLLVAEGAGGVGDQHMEAEVGNLGIILVLNQRIHCVDVLRALCAHVGVVCNIREGIQLLNGTLVIVVGGQHGGLVHNPLIFFLRRLGIADRSLNLILLDGVVDPFLLDGVGDRADDEGENQDQTHAGDQRGQVDLLEDLRFGLPAPTPGIGGVNRCFQRFLIRQGSKVKVIQLGEDVGLRFLRLLWLALTGRFGGLFRLFLPAAGRLVLDFLIRVVVFILRLVVEIGVILRRGLEVGIILRCGLRLIVLVVQKFRPIKVRVVLLFVCAEIVMLLRIAANGLGGQNIVQIKLVNGLIGILVQTQTTEIQLVVVSVGDGFIQLVTAGRHVVKLGKIYICAVFAVQKCLGVEVVIIEMEIHVEIVLSHSSSLPLWYSQ